jgi:hypothetical protein
MLDMASSTNSAGAEESVILVLMAAAASLAFTISPLIFPVSIFS